MDVPVQARRRESQVNPVLQLREVMGSPSGHKLAGRWLPRKTSMQVFGSTVPQTDTGRRGEYPKVLEITHVKELGKMAP